MTWRGVVWRAAGNYGPSGGFEAEKRLGSFTFPSMPEEGTALELGGEDYEVVSVSLDVCHVQPMRMTIW